MARTKRGVISRAKHKKVLKAVKGQWAEERILLELPNKQWKLETINIRDYAIDKHKTVDDTTYGGGSGMLIKPDVLAKSLDKNLSYKEKIIYLSPKGKLLNQKLAKEFSKEGTINIICGHFEGVDQRVIESRNIEEVSIGDFVLSGGDRKSVV